MVYANKPVPSWRILLTALGAAILLSVFGMTTQAQAAAAPVVQQDDAGKGGDPLEVYGRIEAMPDSGLIGQWTISGATYTTVAETEFDEEEGAFALGVCVKVHLKSDGVTVREMDSESDTDCNRDDDDDDGDDDDRDGREFFGLVEAMPDSGLIGQWTISGGVYTVTAQTEIKQRFGTIAVGSCVKVELTQDESAVRELQSKRAAFCNDDDDDDNDDGGFGRGELFGPVVSFPDDLIGEWRIGAISVTANADTEFQQRNGAFTVGGFVKVEFLIQEDGSFLAREIKTINIRGDGDDDDDRDDNRQSKAFGVIQSVPEGNLGIWQISGISYTVTISTELEDKRGALIVGQNVKVAYWQDAAGNRTAKEIKAMPERAGNPDGLNKLVGYVGAMPEDGFVGAWKIGGVDFIADANSSFEEKHGILAEGAYVEVRYVLQDGVLLIVKLETHVPPGGGDDLFFGRIERMDDGLAAAAGTAATWTVGGRTYVVTDATAVSSDLSVGNTAVVNSYAAADGSQVATRISSVTLDNTLYLPAAIK